MCPLQGGGGGGPDNRPFHRELALELAGLADGRLVDSSVLHTDVSFSGTLSSASQSLGLVSQIFISVDSLPEFVGLGLLGINDNDGRDSLEGDLVCSELSCKGVVVFPAVLRTLLTASFCQYFDAVSSSSLCLADWFAAAAVGLRKKLNKLACLLPTPDAEMLLSAFPLFFFFSRLLSDALSDD